MEAVLITCIMGLSRWRAIKDNRTKGNDCKRFFTEVYKGDPQPAGVIWMDTSKKQAEDHRQKPYLK